MPESVALPDPAERGALREKFLSSRNEGLFTPPSERGTIAIPGHNGGPLCSCAVCHGPTGAGVVEVLGPLMPARGGRRRSFRICRDQTIDVRLSFHLSGDAHRVSRAEPRWGAGELVGATIAPEARSGSGSGNSAIRCSTAALAPAEKARRARGRRWPGDRAGQSRNPFPRTPDEGPPRDPAGRARACTCPSDRTPAPRGPRRGPPLSVTSAGEAVV